MFSGGKVPSVLVCPVCHRNDEDSGGGCGHRSFSHVGGGTRVRAHMKVADSGDGFGRRSALMCCWCRLLT